MKTMTTLMSTQVLKFFEPDRLAPEQFYSTLRRSTFVDPERRLMAAILEDAVSCLSKDLHRRPRQHRESEGEPAGSRPAPHPRERARETSDG